MPDRIILINKPYRWTSFDVVKKLRKALLEEKKREHSSEGAQAIRKLKVGHAGTLDPLATGLLVICSGKLTRTISSIQDAEKEYTGTMVIGSVTDSYDLETEPRPVAGWDKLAESRIHETAKGMTGTLLQKPPIHSAKKVDGKRAYDMARRGEEFELKPSEITIKSFEITGIRLPEIDFRIVCSKGTYIRSAINDFGGKLGTGAYLSALCRTRIGEYRLEDALSPDDFLKQIAV